MGTVRYADATGTIIVAQGGLFPMKTAQTRVRAQADAPGIARDFVASHLTEWDTTRCLDAALLAVSELVTNAVCHGSEPVTLRMFCDEDCVRLEVHDADGSLPETRTPAGEDGGFGLRLVGAVCRRWGVVGNGAGKVVWCECAAGLPFGE